MNHAIDRIGEVTETWTSVAQLMADTRWVLTMRLLGLSGAWSMPEGESQTMIGEKIPAFTEAALSGTFAMMSGGSLDRVFRESLEPISSKARANRERLFGRGPLVFGRTVAWN
ncbi:antifreeze protein [Sedimentitalea todarodis]|uniref:Antifreeze protein n=1 Tax=Sedimentitalea todarodis TaxID=1631240 RepID=A0ABU3VFC1_9RHOB|nr:antifreeze protein [Sedimentitalea todarodis]MDU9004869.1 antifreeze protein [Sedimentitalea todarodis]